MLTIAISVLTTLLIIGHVGGVGPWLLWATLVILWFILRLAGGLLELIRMQ